MDKERLKNIPIWAALLVKKRGGNRIAQETAQIYTKKLLIDGKSGATALWSGIRAGIKTSKICNQTTITA